MFSCHTLVVAPIVLYFSSCACCSQVVEAFAQVYVRFWMYLFVLILSVWLIFIFYVPSIQAQMDLHTSSTDLHNVLERELATRSTSAHHSNASTPNSPQSMRGSESPKALKEARAQAKALFG